MKIFTPEWINSLNSSNSGGIFFLAVALTVDTGDVRYFANTQRDIVFDGHTYTPLPMTISGLGQNSQQGLPAVRLTVTNVTGAVGTFLEATNILGHDVLVQLLHLDLLGTTTNQDAIQLQVLAVEWNDTQATFSLGLHIVLRDMFPRHIITAAEFPGVPEGLRRASIL